jgi:ParB-like chromosome segregation protein Spo0J
MSKQGKFPLIKTAQVADLIPYARNSRTHSEEQITQIAASIKEFGFLNPVIVDGENGIIAGHGRVMAAKKLGMTELPAVEASHLTEAQRRAYIIADNKLALNAGWDYEMLKVEFDELSSIGFDINLTGFDDSEIAAYNPDYSFLDEAGDLDNELDQMASEVKKAIQIEFEPEHYDEAQELVKFWRNEGAYVGMMLVNHLRDQKDKL